MENQLFQEQRKKVRRWMIKWPCYGRSRCFGGVGYVQNMARAGGQKSWMGWWLNFFALVGYVKPQFLWDIKIDDVDTQKRI